MRRLLLCPLLAIVCAAANLSAEPPGSALEYFATVTPSRASLGRKVTLKAACRAHRAVTEGVSLDHESLTIELARIGDNAEPRYAFPNRKVIQGDGITIREGPSAPALQLKAGETRERSFELNLLFPQELLRPGDYRIRFTLWDGSRQIRSSPALLRLRSSPTPR